MSVLLIEPRSTPLALQTQSAAATISKAVGFGHVIGADVIDRISHEVLQTLGRQGTAAAGSPEQRPVQLRTPDLARLQAYTTRDGARALSPEALMMALVGDLQQSLDETGLERLRQRHAGHRAAMTARIVVAERLIAERKAASDALDGALSNLDQALTGEEAARDEVETLRDRIESLEQALRDLPGDDPRRTEYEQQLRAARAALPGAQGRQEQAEIKVLAASHALDQASGRLDATQGDADRFNVGSVLRVETHDGLSASEVLRVLLARLSASVAKFADNKRKGDSEILLKELQARDAANIERARKHAEELERAREAEQKTGCIGKIFNWVKAAVAVVASVVVTGIGVLTANPMMVAAGVMGLALSVDYVVQLATGFSLVGKLTEYIAKGVSGVLQAFCVDASLADTIGNIVAIIVVTAAIVAASLATGNAAAAGQSATRLVTLAQQVAQVMQVIAQVAGLAGSVTHGVGQIMVANIQINIAELMAAIESHLFASDVFRDMLAKVAEAAVAIDQTALDMIRQMGQVTQNQTATDLHVLQHIRTTA